MLVAVCRNVFLFFKSYGQMATDSQPEGPRFHGVPNYYPTTTHDRVGARGGDALGRRRVAALEHVHQCYRRIS